MKSYTNNINLLRYKIFCKKLQHYTAFTSLQLSVRNMEASLNAKPQLPSPTGNKWEEMENEGLFQYLESKEPHQSLSVDAEHQNVAQEAVNV